MNDLERDLCLWEEGRLSFESLEQAHPAARIEDIVRQHEKLELLAATEPAESDATWAKISERIEPRAGVLRSLTEWVRRPVLAGFTSAVLATSGAYALDVEPVRDAVDTVRSEIGELFAGSPEARTRLERGGPSDGYQGSGIMSDGDVVENGRAPVYQPRVAKKPTEDDTKKDREDDRDDARVEALEEDRERSRDAKEDRRDARQDRADDRADRAEDAADEAEDAADDAADEAEDRAEDDADEAEDAADDAADEAEDRAEDDDDDED